MSQTPTSFAQLFGLQQPDQPVVTCIEIPMIQRDYAQGRQGHNVQRIRRSFLKALLDAVKPGGKDISLDFVYGDVQDGKLFPLDGQQRLTTLFLLHWYLAWRAGIPLQNQRWTKFSYATRPGARRFCECLAVFHPPQAETKLSEWLIDQPWFQHTWHQDPTIRSVLVMLDDMHEQFAALNQEECIDSWHRLTNAQKPAVSFHLLTKQANELTDSFYITMNSRGKPLTEFENFKAHFESLLKTAHLQKTDVFTRNAHDQFAKKVDKEWADTFWPYRVNNAIDDLVMHYFRFVTDVCAWLSGVEVEDKSDIGTLANKVYGADAEKAASHLKFLFRAFNAWGNVNIKDEFEKLFLSMPHTTAGATNKLILFNAFSKPPADISPVDLFAGCCRSYGKSEWGLSHTLLLYAVLLHRIYKTDNFPRQLRILRNLVEASSNEIRNANMPGLLVEVKRFVVDGTLDGITTFNQAQVANEKDKARLLKEHPMVQDALYGLEDHDLLRGGLGAFDLSQDICPALFIKRANAFHVLFGKHEYWLDLTGAFLAIGNYSTKIPRWAGNYLADFGVSKPTPEPWRDLFKGKQKPHMVKTLMELLDQFAVAGCNLTYLGTIQKNFLQGCTWYGWRYYFVKYSAMRAGKSGRYAMNSCGYRVCMLDKKMMNSLYRDAYLSAILRESDVKTGIDVIDPWFSSYETQERHLVLKRSLVHIQCVDQGWKITEEPADPKFKDNFDRVCRKLGIDENGLYVVQQNDDGYDIQDRVELGGKLLREFVAAGL